MFFHGNLIIGYVQDPKNDGYLFQLTGGEECPVSKDEFLAHLEEYRAYEAARAQAGVGTYRPLPVTLTVKRDVELFPVNPVLRRKRHLACLNQPMLVHGVV
jgi:hypothetical protein